jgi:hypothetical protein
LEEDPIDWQQLWQNYREVILIFATALGTLLTTLLAHRVVPGLWHGFVTLLDKLRLAAGRRVSEAAFEKRYLKYLCEEHRFLRVRGIRTRSPVAIQLEQVYVSLTLNRSSCVRPGTAREGDAAFPERLSERMPAPPVPLAEPRAERSERLSLAETLQRCPDRLVILGGPGTGKTTLLSYLVLKFAQDQAEEALALAEKRLPIPMALRDLPRTGLSLIADNIANSVAAPDRRAVPPGFFAHRLQAGRCIVLLDGMDEVTTEEERRRVAEQIEHLVSTYPTNRYVVTSRPAGYGGIALAGFAEVEVRDFTDEDVKAFARNWCFAIELRPAGRGRSVRRGGPPRGRAGGGGARGCHPRQRPSAHLTVSPYS